MHWKMQMTIPQLAIPQKGITVQYNNITTRCQDLIMKSGCWTRATGPHEKTATGSYRRPHARASVAASRIGCTHRVHPRHLIHKLKYCTRYPVINIAIKITDVRNRKRPNIEPCGEPFITGTNFDMVTITPTRWWLLFNHNATLPDIPCAFNVSISLLNRTLSKALAKCKKTASTFSTESTQPVTLSKN